MTPLQQFYEDLTKNDNAPAFSELSDEQRTSIEKSFGFAAFKLSIAIKEFSGAIKCFVPKRRAMVVRRKH